MLRKGMIVLGRVLIKIAIVGNRWLPRTTCALAEVSRFSAAVPTSIYPWM
jgi:hypothetical protein